MLYTSGSTGNPKGVLNSHLGLVNLLRWMQAAYPLDASNGMLQKASFGFDISIWELFWPLLAGARVVMAEPGRQQDGDYLAGLIARTGVTHMFFVPSMLRAFLESTDLLRCRSLRRVVAGGEALSDELARVFAGRLPWCALHNIYGPSEAAVAVTHWLYYPGAERNGTVPIGRPLANTTVYVLDGAGQPLPVGVAGDLYVGGVQLAARIPRPPPA